MIENDDEIFFKLGDEDDDDYDDDEFYRNSIESNKIKLQKTLEIQKNLAAKKKEKLEKIKQAKIKREAERTQKIKFNYKIEPYVRTFSLANYDDEEFNPYISAIFKTELLWRMLPKIESTILKENRKVSYHEDDALVSCDNFVLLGRSGTGKTLVAMTKIFLLKKCSELKETKCFIKNSLYSQIYLRTIFTTTSSNLISEVKKFYEKLEEKFIKFMLRSDQITCEKKKILEELLPNRKQVYQNEDLTFDHIEVLMNASIIF